MEIEDLRAEAERLAFLQQQYDERTAYMIVHRGACLACSDAVRSAYSDEHHRAERLADALRHLRNHTSVNSHQIELIDAALEADREDAEMNEAKKELEAVVGLVGKATPGEWMLATSCSWRRVVTTEHQPVIIPIIQHSDNHPDLEAGEDHVNLEVSIAAVNFLRTHGSALISAAKDAERWQKLRIQGGWPDTEAAMIGASPEDFDRLIDSL